MPLADEIEEVANILSGYFEDGGVYLQTQYGDQGLSLAREMADLLSETLPQETPFGSLWAEYRVDPEANEAEVIGALEVLDESVPEITIRLEGYLAAFHELDREGVAELVETTEPEATIDIEEITAVDGMDDMDNDDEYREENAYLLGNVEDHSTSAMYIEGLDTSVEPNQSETGEDEDG
jgi:hypothetical protein